jgi:23S rRNA pseudouridine1911/1915/1917 synthase
MITRVPIDSGDVGERLDLVLRRHLRGRARTSRTRIQACIESGAVTVNGVVVRRVSARVADGHAIVVQLPDDARPEELIPEPIAVRAVFEDAWMLAIDKPAGMVVHPAYRNPGGTLMNALASRAREWPAGQRPSLVGRLDKLTSGVVLVAKTAAMHAALQRTAIEKEYLAVVYGRVKRARGSIDLPLARVERLRQGYGGQEPGATGPTRAWRTIVAPAGGAPSLTRFERIASVRAPRVGLTLLRCLLATGRTHQIRVHLAARGWPIVGDPLYGDDGWSNVEDSDLAVVLRAFPRQALHAWRLGFVHPMTGAKITVEAPVPVELAELLSTAGLSRVILRSS